MNDKERKFVKSLAVVLMVILDSRELVPAQKVVQAERRVEALDDAGHLETIYEFVQESKE